jgi:Fe-S-cluster containining protein
MVDLIELESLDILEKYKDSCNRCGWCCSETSTIVVAPEDVKNISKKLHRKREEIFLLKDKDWQIKKTKPCQWWKPNNSKCQIYQIRPRVCRTWPLTIDDNEKRTLHSVSECNYSVTILASKVVGVLRTAGEIV